MILEILDAAGSRLDFVVVDLQSSEAARREARKLLDDLGPAQARARRVVARDRGRTAYEWRALALLGGVR